MLLKPPAPLPNLPQYKYSGLQFQPVHWLNLCSDIRKQPLDFDIPDAKNWI
jgi:hypothetical protein